MILYVNFDGTSRLPGARFGGAAFESLLDKNRFDHFTVESYLRSNEDVFAEIKKINLIRNVRVVFGGEHSISYPLIVHHINRGCKKIVIFDAHHDSYNFDQLTHFSFAAKLLEEFEVEILAVGVRYELGKAHPRLKVLSIQGKSSTKIFTEICDFIGEEKFYLSVDLDVIDPQEWQQVSSPVIGGMSIKSLADIIGKLKLIAARVETSATIFA